MNAGEEMRRQGGDTRGRVIRRAEREDVPDILILIRELAEYERLTTLMSTDEAGLADALFGPHPGAEVLLAHEDGALAGFAVFCHNFSTFLGRRGLWLEDLFVRPAYRRRGIGRALLVHLARLAVERGCGRFEWMALDWNTPAWDFYRAFGAAPMEEWTTFRVTGQALHDLAARK
ncbi:MAG: GNAT family N-acetyltransferase [Betaproteobacteria bacterium]|jgi:GNAT superfamily N-acetyltransferase